MLVRSATDSQVSCVRDYSTGTEEQYNLEGSLRCCLADWQVYYVSVSVQLQGSGFIIRVCSMVWLERATEPISMVSARSIGVELNRLVLSLDGNNCYSTRRSSTITSVNFESHKKQIVTIACVQLSCS